MTGGRQSDHQLIVNSAVDGTLSLTEGEYRFGGGTHVLGGTLAIHSGGQLVSNVHVYNASWQPGGTLWLSGTVRGNVFNDGLLTTRHVCGTGLNLCDNDPRSRIEGDYSQSWSGTLQLVLGWDLQVTGRATLDGMLGLIPGTSRSYVLPTASTSILLLHAADGLSGQFQGWTSPGLFLEGTLRYTDNDAFFDATRVSLQSAAAAKGIRRPLSLASAGNLDRALAVADGFALAPQASLSEAQRQFLASSASIMWQQDTAQAIRSFDSLAGHAHVGLGDRLHRHAEQASARLDARLARQDYAAGPVSWSGTFQSNAGAHGFAGLSSGVDQWLSPRLLVGSSVSSGQASLHFDRLGGHGWGEAPTAGLHLHYRGAGWHVTGAVGAGRARLQLQRPIELGAAGRHLAHSQRGFGHAFAHAELGRDLRLGVGSLVPFVALDYGITHSDGFAEQGGTGLELVAGPSRQARLSGALGARYAHDWDLDRQTLRFELDVRYRHDLVEGDPMLAAFRGVPDVRFELPDAGDPAAGELRVGLGGELGLRSRWSLEHDRAFGGDRRDRGWRLGLQHAF